MPDEESTRAVSSGDTAASDPSSLKGLTMALGIEPASPDHDPILGRDIGGVTIVRLIAEGGMGRVYEGIQEAPKRTVAVKIMRPGFVSKQAHQRFGMELEILGALRHPYIAQIYSAGVCDVAGSKVPFFVMEYIPDARPITRYAKEMMLGIDARIALFHKVCEAVAHGHAQGVIHRDLKPSNILVEKTGVPKIIDFGIARTIGDSADQVTALTELGQLVGTLQYMSPEQIAADPASIDQRSDVYALGVILYELLTGTRPYDVSNRQIVEAAGIVRDQKPISPLKLNPDLPAWIVSITGKCLQKVRSNRYADATDVAAAIADGSATDGPTHISFGLRGFFVSERSWPWARSSLRVVVGSSLLTILGLLVIGLVIMYAPHLFTSRFPKGAVTFRGHTYFFPEYRVTQIEAWLEAEKLGGTLAVVDDVTENEFLADHVRGPTWLGIDKSDLAWHEIHSDKPVTYFAWDHRQPSNDNGEIAASTSPSGAWHDNLVSDRLYYCVEWPEVDARQRNATAPAAPDAGADSVVGRWQWFVNGEEVIGHEFMPNGQVKGHRMSSWLCVDPNERRYQFDWEGVNAMDVLTLSADGRHLRGRNNLGFTIVGRRHDR